MGTIFIDNGSVCSHFRPSLLYYLQKNLDVREKIARCEILWSLKQLILTRLLNLEHSSMSHHYTETLQSPICFELCTKGFDTVCHVDLASSKNHPFAFSLFVVLLHPFLLFVLDK